MFLNIDVFRILNNRIILKPEFHRRKSLFQKAILTKKMNEKKFVKQIKEY